MTWGRRLPSRENQIVTVGSEALGSTRLLQMQWWKKVEFQRGDCC